jgi:DNA-binding transcriptional LysR family regulator
VTLHDLSSEEMLTQLGSGKLQVALTVRPPAKLLRRLSFLEIARYAMVMAVAPGHPLVKLKAVTLQQVAAEPLVGLSRKDYPEYHVEMRKLFATIGRKPNFAEEHEGGTSVVAAVEAGRGVALVPSSLACMVGTRVKLLPLKPALPLIRVGAVRLKESESNLTGKFISLAQGDHSSKIKI